MIWNNFISLRVKLLRVIIATKSQPYLSVCAERLPQSSVCLSVCLCAFFSTWLYLRMSVFAFSVFLSLFLRLHVFLSIFIRMSDFLSVCVPICLSVSLYPVLSVCLPTFISSFYLSVCRPVFLPMYTVS